MRARPKTLASAGVLDQIQGAFDDKKTFFEVEPDRISTTGDARHRQYSFTYYEPDKGDHVGAYLVLVTSPARFKDTWTATKFYRAAVAAYQAVAGRELTPREIGLFQQRIKVYEQAATM